MRYSEFETEKEFKKFCRENKITLKMYFEKYEPRYDLLTNKQIEFKDVPQYIIRQAWLGEGYLCSYRDRDGNLQVYDHDAFYERNKDKIDNNKSWNNPTRPEVTDGQKKEATLR